MPPMPTVWWFRPERSAARVGEQSAVVWKRLYFSPPAARRSAVGVMHGPPNALEAAKPTSSRSTISTLGAPAGGLRGSIGGENAPRALPSGGRPPGPGGGRGGGVGRGGAGAPWAGPPPLGGSPPP